MKRLVVTLGCAFTVAMNATAGAGEIGHYSPAGAAIRDMVMPEPGARVAVLYNIGYSTGRINDPDGDEIRSVDIGGNRVDVSASLDFYAISPTLIWVSKWRLLGGKYGAYVAPCFDNASVSAAFTSETGRAKSIDASELNLGDLYVQPFWLGWTAPHYDAAFGYGIYVPIGRYDTETHALPGGGSLTAEAPDNLGYGFWTHQVQAALTTYPWAHRKTAIATVLTWEGNQKKRDFDLTPGQNLSFSMGVSQIAALKRDHSLLFEFGPAGYGTWQITDDRGADARNPDVHDRVLAMGGEIGLIYAPWKSGLTLRYMHEVETVDRFQGNTLAVNWGVRF